ncbi:MAG: acetylglutamate kinase [Clostridia bacterium]|nr:acetylglutamate kinase [Clostridia bacterium]
MEHINTAQRAETLMRALPYIQKYYGKIVVIKYGGNAMINEELKHAVMGDIALLSLVNMKVVLVHGGGPEISTMLNRVGKKSEFVNGLRVTDAETAEIVQMVLAGKVNKSLVSHLGTIGCKAIGLSGMDGGMIKASKASEELGFVGNVESIDPKPILDVLDRGYVPIISTLGTDAEGNTYNINADTAAAHIAGALGAECLISMTDIAGLLRDVNDLSSLIPKVTLDDCEQLKKEGIISGGMIPKIDCCIEAIHRGVRKVFIIDGRIKHATLIELLTDEGIGTMFTR